MGRLLWFNLFKPLPAVFTAFSSVLLLGCSMSFNLKEGLSDGASSEFQINELLQVDVSSTGELANAPVSTTLRLSMSQDGRFVVFNSTATNLVTGDTNGVSDVFVRDLVNRTTKRVSVASDGTQGNGLSDDAVISGNGRYVFFRSAATNLVAGDVNGKLDIFRYDLLLNQTDVASNTPGGVWGNGDAGASLTTDYTGEKLGFVTLSTNLSGVTDANANVDVYLKDFTANTLVLISERRVAGVRNGNTGGNAATAPTLTSDGTRLFFYSSATNLVPGDTNGARDIFLYDLGDDSLTIVSVTQGGAQVASNAWYPRTSGDGRYFTFHSGNGWVAGDTNGVNDSFRKDIVSGEVLRISVASNGDEALSGCAEAVLADDGDLVVFHCGAGSSNLISTDTNGRSDSFVRRISTSTTTRISEGIDGTELNGDSNFPIISGDGRRAAFYSNASNVPGAGTIAESHVYVKILSN